MELFLTTGKIQGLIGIQLLSQSVIKEKLDEDAKVFDSERNFENNSSDLIPKATPKTTVTFNPTFLPILH